MFERKRVGNVQVLQPTDRAILSAIKEVCPEHYDIALENYMKKLEAKK